MRFRFRRPTLKAGWAAGVLPSHKELPSSPEGAMEWVAAVWFFGHGPIVAALIIGLFWAVLVHPERIRNPLEFRLSVLCLGASILASVLIPMILLVFHQYTGGRADRANLGASLLFCAVSPLLTMLALLLGV